MAKKKVASGRKPKRANPRLEHNPGEYVLWFQFSLPPSVNSIWVRGRYGQFISPNYRQWRSKNIPKIPQDHAYYLESDVSIVIDIYAGKGFRSNSDIDNRVKGILDLLVWGGVIQDDSARHVCHICVTLVDRNFKNKHAAYADVTVKGLSNGFQKIPGATQEAPVARKPKGYSKAKPKSRSTGGKTLHSPP